MNFFTPHSKPKSTYYGRGIWNIKIWIVLAILFFLLAFLDTKEPRSSLWFLEPFLYGLLIFGLWANSKFNLRKLIHIPRRFAPLAYIILAWSFGMIYELALTVNGTGVGGMHQNTLASFILAQGIYIPLVIVSFLVIRYLRLSYKETFFLAGGVSIVEGLIFRNFLLATILSPLFWLSPLVLAYYTVVYGGVIALPLLFINEELLWPPNTKPKTRSILSLWVWGFIIEFIILLFWGLLYGPFAESLFNLPPNIL